MSDIFELNDKFKKGEDPTTPTTDIPESVSEESASMIEANLSEFKINNIRHPALYLRRLRAR